MVLLWFMLNILIVADATIISDMIQSKHIHHCVSLNFDKATEIQLHRIMHKHKIKFSSRRIENSTITIAHSYAKVAIVLNANGDWESIFDLLELNIKKAFKNPFTWIIFTDDLENTFRVLSQYPVDVDADLTIIHKEDGVYNLHEIYNTGFYITGEFITRAIGVWNGSLHYHRKNRFNLKGLMLRGLILLTKDLIVGNQTFEEYLERRQPSLTFIDTTHKVKYYTVLKYYQDMFNITYTFTRTNSWGYPTKTGFDGLVGGLYRFEADIGSPVFLRADRIPAVDYVAQTWQTRICFVFRHPRHSGGYYTIYTRPLSSQVWCCCVLFLLLSTVFLRQMLTVKKIRAAGDETEDSLSYAFLFSWGAMCQQGSAINRNSTAIKVMIFVTFLYSLTLYQYYNALVVSTLLQEQPKNIRNMRLLLDSGLKAGIEDMLYTRDFFKRTTDPLAIEMYQKKIATGTEYNFHPAQYGMSLVKRGGYAFHVELAVAYRVMQNTFSPNELCEAAEVQMYLPQHPAAVLPKDSPYKEFIAYAIRLMKERGLLHRLQTLWDAPRPACVRDPGSNLISVSIKEFQTALIVLAVGYITSLLLLALEILGAAVKKSNWRCNFRWRIIYDFRK